MSPVDVRIAVMASTLLVAAQDRPEDLLRTSDTLVKLLSQLPVATAADEPPYDLTRLSTDEFNELDRLCCIARGEAEPTPIASLPEREIGPSEAEGIRVGRWLDERRDDLRRRMLTEDEQLFLRNGFQAVAGTSFICRNLFRDIFLGDMQTEIERAVAAALKAIGSDARVVPCDPAQIEPPKQIGSIHDVPGALTVRGRENGGGPFDGFR